LRGADWIAQQSEAARRTARPNGTILVIDEVPKAVGWSESVKRLWDEDTRAKRRLKVLSYTRMLGQLQDAGNTTNVFYWRERTREVDFVVHAGRTVTAIEVKSGRRHDTLPGLGAFVDSFRPTRTLLVGPGGMSVEEFLLQPVVNRIGR
jgi:predicted AAA+ superfamily ATPase